MTDVSLPPRMDAAFDPAVVGTVVVGAGIGGLLAAITAAEARPGDRVIVLDPHPPGGRARCDQRAGFRFNRGPRALYRGGVADRALQGVGVDTSRGGKPDVRAAIAIRDGQPHRFPGGPLDSARTSLFTAREKVEVSRALAAMWRSGASDNITGSVTEWMEARSLSTPVRQFVEALVRVSTYAHAPDTFAAGPAFANARAGVSPGVFYLDGGWQSLVDQLVAIAAGAGVEIRRSAAAGITAGSEGVAVAMVDGSVVRAASAVIAAGSPDTASTLLGGHPRSWGVLAPPVTAACLELGIRGRPTHAFALGIDEPVYGSLHAPPAELAPDGHGVVHLLRYQPPGDEMAPADQRARLQAVAALMGITPDQIVTDRFLARMVVSGSLPHPSSGGLGGRPAVAVREHPGVLLVGDWVGPRGLLLDAVAASATEAGRLAASRSATMVPA